MENQELKYPIKYAVQELTQYGGWENSFVDTIKGYIVSKCYVVEKNTMYYADGKEETSYNVVFPYQDIEAFQKSIENGLSEKSLGTRNYPRLNVGGGYYPVNKIDNVYDTYEEAYQVAKEKNEKLRSGIYSPQYAKYNENEVANEIGRGIAIATLFEHEVSERTQDMVVSTEQSRIVR